MKMAWSIHPGVFQLAIAIYFLLGILQVADDGLFLSFGYVNQIVTAHSSILVDCDDDGLDAFRDMAGVVIFYYGSNREERCAMSEKASVSTHFYH